ncbi:hypothetical protein [Mycoplasmoides pneumoniae]|uniref:Wheel complex protein MPN_387 n=5 Tax=Mycoplasmoides pneumoniae TaxID=2104 RepID=MP387_MYCPN|nr:hypothetical protein [Mycoplasmoides pneumoniae]P75395.1 RecName: Full=Uncharacterized protein MG269 homolog [Mycoplasmoides pneumoniae M129]AAB96098.1 conserved hypothetical protein [Mycoplasmoides pneumoniae M129]ADK86980.1 conserved hypothetical protein [Mycoplasmoides pneumoniae FH]AGC04295.1 hypothetical protein C985_0390 [Mycoplasmoides pneumoniae M129-B7]ALA30266.1 hypothetical protein C897_02205 [Mycoplasmoides pneumoniae PI 1428]ALA31215.1 hypothetical protein B434_03695 [Mycoplas
MTNFEYYRDFDDFQRRETINFFLSKFPLASQKQLQDFLEQARQAYVQLRQTNPAHLDWNQTLLYLAQKFLPEKQSEKDRLKKILVLQEQLKVRYEGEIKRQSQQNSELLIQLGQRDEEIIQMQQLFKEKERQLEVYQKQLNEAKEYNHKLEEHYNKTLEEALKEYEQQCTDAIHRRDEEIQAIFTSKLNEKNSEITQLQTYLQSAVDENEALQKQHKLVLFKNQKYEKMVSDLQVDLARIQEINNSLTSEKRDFQRANNDLVKQYNKLKNRLEQKLGEITNAQVNGQTHTVSLADTSQQFHRPQEAVIPQTQVISYTLDDMDDDMEVEETPPTTNKDLPRGATQPKRNSIKRVSKLID